MAARSRRASSESIEGGRADPFFRRGGLPEGVNRTGDPSILTGFLSNSQAAIRMLHGPVGRSTPFRELKKLVEIGWLDYSRSVGRFSYAENA